METVTFRCQSLVWFVTGAVLSAAATLVFVTAWTVDAAPGNEDATFVAITPCRLADTRPAPDRVGLSGTLSAADTRTFVVHGDHGECTIPSEAVAVSSNVTALRASTQTFLTFWPEGARPLAASLNPAPGQPPTPNAVTVDLSAAGGFNVYNDRGAVDVVIDINGYYVASSLQELDARISTLETDTAALEADVAANTAATDANAAAIGVLDDQQPFAVYSEFSPESPNCTNGPCTGFKGDTTTMQSITVTAPASGRVTVNATGTFTSLGGVIECQLSETENDPNTTNRALVVATSFEAMTLTRAFVIGAGSTNTYYLRCRNQSASASVFYGGMMTAIWTPSP